LGKSKNGDTTSMLSTMNKTKTPKAKKKKAPRKSSDSEESAEEEESESELEEMTLSDDENEVGYLLTFYEVLLTRLGLSLSQTEPNENC